MAILLTTFSNDWLLYGLFTTEALPTRPTEWHLAIHTGDPGVDGSNEVTAGSDADYARAAIAFAEDVGLSGALDVLSNSSEVTLPAVATGANYTATWISIWDASTAGNCLAKGQLPGAGKTLTEGMVFTVPAGDLVLKAR